MTRERRRAHLLQVALMIVADDGADSLTLGRLAVLAGVSKPVVYDHFGSREVLLGSLYSEFDRRQTATLLSALASAPPTLKDQVTTIARCHIECVIQHGAVLAAIVAALNGSPVMAEILHQSNHDYLELCRRAICDAAGEEVFDEADAVAFLGAADALGVAAAEGVISAARAEQTLSGLLLSLTTGSDAPGKTTV